MPVKECEVHLRAPTEDGAIVLAPSWRDMVQSVNAPSEFPPPVAEDHLGDQTTDIRRQARSEIVQLAAAYTAQYVDADAAPAPRQPLVLTGHQPEMAHAGVWLKNFAASELAEQCGGTAINLTIDVDLCRSNSVAVPTGDLDAPRVTRVPLDAPRSAIPWEQRAIVDAELWRSFGERASEAIRPLVGRPMVRSWWPKAVERGLAAGSIGEGVSQARHHTEIEWGRPSLQLPQSAVCRSESFRRFACCILARLPAFHTAYNDSLADYRHRRGVRNAAQPMPDLVQTDGWLETPFWVWSNEDPTRRALLVMSDGDQLRLTDRNAFHETLTLDDDGVVEPALDQLAQWESRGVKLRSRALITTMFARLAVSDLFIHGIGGSKYDEVTDEICRRFFGVEPTPYATLSGTLRLPIPHESVGEAEIARCRRSLRDLQYHGELSLQRVSLNPQQAAAAEAAKRMKRRWIETPKTPSNAAERHQGIVAANETLAALLAPYRRQLERAEADAKQRARATATLESREYAFCLFPLERLREFLLDFSNRLP